MTVVFLQVVLEHHPLLAALLLSAAPLLLALRQVLGQEPSLPCLASSSR